MRSRRTCVLAALLAGCAVLAACTSSTDGSGSSTSSAAPGPTTAVPTVPSRSVTTSAPAGSSSASGHRSAPPPSTAPPTRAAPAKPLTTLTVQGQHATYVIKVWAQVKSKSCHDHAYGQAVVTFLTKNPCRGLYRRIATTTVGGRRVGFNQAQLSFSGADPSAYRTAADFQALVTKDGAGNISDLLRDGYRLPSGPTRVPSPDAFKALDQDSAVTITDAWYLDGRTPENDPALSTMAEDLFLQF